MLDSNDDMDEDNEIPLEIPDRFELAQTPPDESVFDVKKENTVADAFPGCKILCDWPAVVWMLNLSNHNKDGSPEAPHFTRVLLEEQKS